MTSAQSPLPETAITPDMLAEWDKAHLIHPGTSVRRHLENGPLIFVEGDGARLRDIQGNWFIDGYSAMGTQLCGWGRKEIAEAIYNQSQQLSYNSNYWGHSNPPAIQLAARLAAMLPGSLNHVYFTSSGSEANETAFKLARYYFAIKGEPERFKIISRDHSYHGLTLGTLSAIGLPHYQKNFGPMAPGFLRVSPFSPDDLEQRILEEGPETVAAFVAEPVIGAGGHMPPPNDYFARVREICNRYGILFIADEVITGFGRTGSMFAIEHWGVEPDLMSMAKGITSGYLPLGATALSDHVFNVLADAPGAPVLAHGNTYSGHATCCAAALANLDILEGERLAERSKELGAYMLEQLKKLKEYPQVGEVRGLGLLAAVELWRDAATRTPFSPEENVGQAVCRVALEQGVIIRPIGDTISLRPPLVISKEQVDQMVGALESGIKQVAARG